MNILISNCSILPMTDQTPRCFEGSIGIEGERIVLVSDDPQAVEAFRERHREGLREIDGRGFLAMPGLINAHNHASMTLMRSYADDIPLMSWLNDHIWPFEAKMDREDVRLGAELGVAEMLLGGTTTFVDMYWMQEAVGEVVEQTGIRAVLSATFTEARYADFERDFAAISDRYAGGRHPRISLMVAPHSPYSTSTEHLSRARELSERYGIGINIHISETLDEQRTIQERYGKTPIEYLYDLGLLTPQTLAVHSVHVNDADLEIMRRCGVSVVHNPQSNMKISSGIAPVAKMLDAGINVAIGTDGPCSNNDLDMWDEMRSASFLQKVSTGNPCVLPAYEVLKMATVYGARAIGMADQIGSLREGMLADVILLDLNKPHLSPQYDVVANLIYCAKSSDVDTVIVHGDILVEGGQLLRMDCREICRVAQARVAEIQKR